MTFLLFFLAEHRPEPRRPVVLWRRGVAQHLGLPGEDQEGAGAARHVLRLQDRRRLPLQGETQAKEKVHHAGE